MDMQISNIWIASGVILGFQVTWFTWRISREVKMEKVGETTWLPCADWMNLISMVFLVVGVFVLPVLGIVQFAEYALGLALILLVGYPFALAGHYELYKSQGHPRPRFPYQEKVPIIVAAIIAILYSVYYFCWVF